MRVLSFDPSGNWSKREGSGTSGWAFFEDGELKEFGDVRADKAESIEDYWAAHSELMDVKQPHIVVCESYKLQPGKAMVQSFSAMETPQLIGYLRMACWLNKIRFVFQDPSCKPRVADPILERMGIIERKGRLYYCQGRLTNDHMRDAIRHGIYWHKYGDKS